MTRCCTEAVVGLSATRTQAETDSGGQVGQRQVDCWVAGTEVATSRVVRTRFHGIRSDRTPACRGSRGGRRCRTAGPGTGGPAGRGTGGTGQRGREVDGREARMTGSEGRSRRRSAEDG